MRARSQPSCRNLIATDVQVIHRLCIDSLSVVRTLDDTRQALLARNQVVRVLVDACDGFAGYALGWQVKDLAELTEIAIRSSCKGQGWGRWLLDDFIEYTRGLGAKTVDLEVKENNQIAIALYESSGFLKVGSRSKYYRDGADAYLYSLELS
ncbi:MAG: GNAT family N-acetyltransferase [Myxococcota bacterium]|nr:GNAT family N-acetyltransferase [Myxococcota bacterium]